MGLQTKIQCECYLRKCKICFSDAYYLKVWNHYLLKVDKKLNLLYFHSVSFADS